jgi:MFS family permease
MFFVPAAQGATIAGASLLIAQQLFGDGGFTMQDVNYMSLRQAVTPSHLLGRVNSFFYNLDLVAMLAGTLIGGVLGEIIGLRPTLVIGALLTLAAVAVLIASPIATLRRTPPSPDARAEPLPGEASPTGGSP